MSPAHVIIEGEVRDDRMRSRSRRVERMELRVGG